MLATGFRNPDGLGILPDGTLTVPCSEGDWTPASMICVVRPSAGEGPPPHYGYGGPRAGQPSELPLLYLPRGLDNSSGEQVAIPAHRWGPLAGSLLHLSFGACSWGLVLIDEVDGQWQGGYVPLAGDFPSGVHRGRFSRFDPHCYVSGMNGWGTYASQDGCFARIRLVDEEAQHPVGFHVHRNGVLIEFAQPLDIPLATRTSSHFAQAWNYRYSGAYGSPELSPSHPGVVGHDRLVITDAVATIRVGCFWRFRISNLSISCT